MEAAAAPWERGRQGRADFLAMARERQTNTVSAYAHISTATGSRISAITSTRLSATCPRSRRVGPR